MSRRRVAYWARWLSCDGYGPLAWQEYDEDVKLLKRRMEIRR